MHAYPGFFLFFLPITFTTSTNIASNCVYNTKSILFICVQYTYHVCIHVTPQSKVLCCSKVT